MEEVMEEQGFLLEVDIGAAEKSRVQWNMLEHNKVPELLPFQYYYRDDKVCFQYATGGLQPIEEYFRKKKGGFDTLYFLCTEIAKIVEKGEEYLLKSGEYFIAPERIYWNRPERKIRLCYLPGNQGDLRRGYIALAEYLMQHGDHGDEQAVKFIYGLYDRLTTDCFSIDGLNGYFSQFKTELPERKEKTVPESPVAPKTEYYLAYCGDLWKGMPIWREGIGEYPLPWKEELLVGRDGTGDVVIPCPEISRRQAVLFRENSQFFLIDQDSTNGTYLNGRRVSSRERVSCREGDDIRFANHSFKLACRNI